MSLVTRVVRSKRLPALFKHAGCWLAHFLGRVALLYHAATSFDETHERTPKKVLNAALRWGFTN